MDKLLEDLYKIYSPSKKEDEMINFIIKELSDSATYGELTVNLDDKTHNIYVTKGKGDKTHGFYPCAVAHMDQVQTYGATHVFEVNDTIFGWNCEKNAQAGLGADDKNGIWCVLKLLQKFDTMKAAFFVGEEIGCVGSGQADSVFFEDVKFVLQADRRNGSDIIFTANNTSIASKTFIDAVKKLYTNRGYKSTTGLSTDVWKLASNKTIDVSACNISCGYYHPHTNEEYTVISELENCLDLMSEIFNKVSFRCPHVASFIQTASSKTSYGSYKYDFDDDWNDYGYPSSSYSSYGSYSGGTSYVGGYSTKPTTTSNYSTSSSSSSSASSSSSPLSLTTTRFFENYQDLVLQLLDEQNLETLNIASYYKKYYKNFPYLLPRDFISAQLDAIVSLYTNVSDN